MSEQEWRDEENLFFKLSRYQDQIEKLIQSEIDCIGIAFILYGIGKFPLPPEGLMEYFGLSPFLASLVAISEVSTGIILLIANFIKNPIGHTLSRLAGLNIVILMVCIFAVAHRDWFINKRTTSSPTFVGFFVCEMMVIL